MNNIVLKKHGYNSLRCKFFLIVVVFLSSIQVRHSFCADFFSCIQVDQKSTSDPSIYQTSMFSESDNINDGGKHEYQKSEWYIEWCFPEKEANPVSFITIEFNSESSSTGTVNYYLTSNTDIQVECIDAGNLPLNSKFSFKPISYQGKIYLNKELTYNCSLTLTNGSTVSFFDGCVKYDSQIVAHFNEIYKPVSSVRIKTARLCSPPPYVGDVFCNKSVKGLLVAPLLVDVNNHLEDSDNVLPMIVFNDNFCCPATICRENSVLNFKYLPQLIPSQRGDEFHEVLLSYDSLVSLDVLNKALPKKIFTSEQIKYLAKNPVLKQVREQSLCSKDVEICPIKRWATIKNAMEIVFPIEQIPLHQSYGEWIRSIIAGMATNYNHNELDGLHLKLSEFCKNIDLSVQEVWFLSLYDSKRAKASRYFATNQSLEFDKGTATPQVNSSMVSAAKNLLKSVSCLRKKYQDIVQFINKRIEELRVNENDKRNIIEEMNEAQSRIKHAFDEGISGDYCKVIINNCATCVTLCPSVISFCRMRVLSSLDNHWLNTLNKLFIKSGMLAVENNKTWPCISTRFSSSEEAIFLQYVKSILENMPDGTQNKNKLTEDIVKGASDSAIRLDKLWGHTQNELKTLFFDEETFDDVRLLNVPASYVIIAALQKNAKKAPEDEKELNQLCLNITQQLKRIKSVVPSSYKLHPQYFPVKMEYNKLIQAGVQHPGLVLPTLLENSTLSYVTEQIALVTRGLYKDFLSSEVSGGSLGDNFISTLESITYDRCNELSPNDFCILLEHLINIQQKMNDIYNTFSQVSERDRCNIMERSEKLRQLEHRFIKATQGKITVGTTRINTLRYLSDIVSHAHHRLLDDSQDDDANVFMAFKQLDIRENGEKIKDASSDINIKKLLTDKKLSYAWLFLKACIDEIKRIKDAQNSTAQYLPIDLQLQTYKRYVPFLARLIVLAPKTLVEKSKDAVESLIWGKFQWPYDAQSKRLVSHKKPISKWSEHEIKSFINTSGYLKVNKNYHHWWHLGREEKSNKGIETIPESNSMVVTTEIIESIQFITEMVITYSIHKAERELSKQSGDLSVDRACSILKSLLAENGEIKKRYDEVIDYRKNYLHKSVADHKRIGKSGSKLLEPSEIIMIVLQKSLLDDESLYEIQNIIDKSIHNGWLRISKNYFQIENVCDSSHRLVLEQKPVKTSAYSSFFHAYKWLGSSWQEVLSCDYMLSTLQHTDDELSYLIQGMSLPMFIPKGVLNDDTKVSNFCVPVELESLQASDDVTSAIIGSELRKPFPPKLFELAAKLFSDNIDSTGTHLAYHMLNGSDSHAPHHLDQEVESIQKSSALKKLNEFYTAYCKDMSDPNKRWEITEKLDKLLASSQLSGWWDSIRKYARSGVEALAQWDVWILPVYITWSLLTSKSLTEGGEVLNSVMDIRDLSATSNNDTSIENVIHALEACSRDSSNASTSTPENQSLVSYVQSMREQSEKIHKKAAGMSSRYNNNFGASEGGWYTANIVSSVLATVVGLVQSAGWFGDQLSIMEKTLATENIGLITGMLSPLLAEHYLKMEVGERLYQPAFEICECRNKDAGQAGCPIKCKPKCECRYKCTNHDSGFDYKTCGNSCCDVMNRCHDGLACIHTCPETSVHTCFGMCCDLDKSPCARNVSQATSYCCCCLCAGPGMLCAPLKAIVGNNPHNYKQIVSDRLDGASERTIGTATRTVPYNTFKEFLNTGDKRKAAILLGRVFALTVDGVIAVGEIAKFSCQANAFEKHESVSRTLSKIYTAEVINEADADVLSKLYNSDRALYLLYGEKIAKIPFRSVDKVLAKSSWLIGSAALAYSVSQVPYGIIGTCVKPCAAAFPTKPIKRLWNIVRGKESDDTWKGVMQNTLKTGINLSDRTIKEKVPAGTSVYFLGKSQRLSSSRRAPNMGNNTQAILGNLKNGITGPYNRTLLQSGDPAAMTFAGAIDAAEGFVVDAGNSESSARNMLNIPPAARIAGRHLIEACWHQAMNCVDIPKRYTFLAKEKVGLLALDGVTQHSDFIAAYLNKNDGLLQEDWVKLKSLKGNKAATSRGRERLVHSDSVAQPINTDSFAFTKRNARSKESGSCTPADVTVTISDASETIEIPKLNHNPFSHGFHHAFLAHQLNIRTNGILHPSVKTELGELVSEIVTTDGQGLGAGNLEFGPPPVTMPFTKGKQDHGVIDALVTKAMGLDLNKASVMSSLLPILIGLSEHEVEFMAYYSQLQAPRVLSGCKSHQN
ncbi:MAG: hypothetical protein QS748_07420 [Candidatus Endonucleobacter bathymodioli]|uniref:Uncharacterized protein n=1 Tax=Candidatus Endonucleibacter bathymodioli TaxID=539814 RepID=A0AA90SXX1_9GAMM|nr:hypothetical protein [Candidatus Endonucleobacter bathymodioli]